MSKLDSKPHHEANIPLSSHDLSHSFDYTSAIGMILPVCQDLLNPGEKISVNVDLSNTRTMPMQAAAFCDIDLHVDYFFVPMTLMLSPFEAFIYQTKDVYSSILQSNNTGLPLLNLSNVATLIENAKSFYPIGQNLGAFECNGKSYFRLFDMLGLNPFIGSMTDSISNDFGLQAVTPDYYPNVFPWQILAYNAIYQYYFRLDDYEVFNASRFNVDQFYNAGVINPGALDFTLKYRPQYMDYFNSVKNSPIVTVTNVLAQPDALPLAKNWLSREQVYSGGFSTLVNGSVGSPSSGSGPHVGSPTNQYQSPFVTTNFGFTADFLSNYPSSSVNGNDINTANLRAIFANEKLWSITGSAKKTYDAQTLAHFGFNVPTDIKHQVQHLGHDVTTVHIGEVISTSGTSTQPLGTIAGKGYAENKKGSGVKFTAPCHGVLMVVTSSMVKPTYIGGFNKINAIASWQDFYQPEFDHLGMQPIFGYEVTNASSSAADLLGWQYRYEQFKRKYDHASRAFSDGYFGSWTNVQRPYKRIKGTAAKLPTGDAATLLSTPLSLNGITIVPYTTSWKTEYETNPYQIYEQDPLIHHALISYHKLSTMSTYSMPRLDA